MKLGTTPGGGGTTSLAAEVEPDILDAEEEDNDGRSKNEG